MEELLADQENTLPTYHPKIMVARVRTYDFLQAAREIGDLLESYALQDDELMVQKMKKIVPEFVSQNSKFESLDYSKIGERTLQQK
jgi:FlaA1/EpsC-like NDP-sugar epimerase